jgi:hypothetical protein
MSTILLNDAQTTTGAGEVRKWVGENSLHTIQFKITGSITAVTMILEGSNNDVDFVPLQDYDVTASDLSCGCGAFNVIDKIAESVQVNISVLTGSGSVSIWHTVAQ